MRISKDPAVRKQEIIDTAKELFEKQGIKKTSISEIATKSGIAKGLVYYYFSSKEELVENVVEDFIKGVDKELDTIVNNGSLDFYLKLKAILHLYFNSIQVHPAISTYSPDSQEIFNLIKNRLSETAFIHSKDLIRIGMQRGILNVQYPEYMLQIIINGLGDLYIEGITDLNVHRTLIEQLLGLEGGALE